MLSTQYRLRLEAICEKIVSGDVVSLDDMIWANKLAKANEEAVDEVLESNGLNAAIDNAEKKTKSKAAQKIKKNEELISLELHKTKDILLHLGSIKKENQVLVGFAMETENEIDNAIKKASKKNADFIVLNSVNTQNEAFGSDLNTVSFVNTKGKFKAFEKKSKKEIAIDIVEEIILISQKNE